MVASISQTQIKTQQAKQVPKTTKASIFYVNDVHAQIDNIERLKTAVDNFTSTDTNSKGETVDKLILSGGDFDLGTDFDLNRLAVAGQNALGIMATVGGNHEFDLLKKEMVELLKDKNFKLLCSNLVIPETSEDNIKIKNQIQKSCILEQNGTKYGLIGVMPVDFLYHVSNPQEYSDFKVLALKETGDVVQKEIDNLKSQGIDKIIVLSHAGYEDDVQLAKHVEGIDVIIGGHTHKLLDGIQEGKNLFYSKKTGEPTIITEAGKNGNYFGILNLEFNENGVITKAQNNLTKSEKFSRNPIMKYLTNSIFGKPSVVGKINSSQKYSLSLITENPSADFINDAVKNELNVDVVLMNPGNMRENIEAGDLTDRDLSNLTPFRNKMCIFKMTEKELVDTVKIGAKSITDPECFPGIIQVSGLKYTMTKSGEVKSITYIDKDGKEIPININNPNPFKTYRVGADSYVARGGNDYVPYKWDKTEVKFDFDKDKLVIDYLEKLNSKNIPVDIKTDGRINIVES